ncbi:hypothetical protein BG006_003768 [Podila minutissima]|uniref:Uncharacterized protein n=1 Tax=Podila minutissima TaxID=64525 RepID=A0A9P5SQ41_9FUNG|nr:hypothetical protein BG006_003768 [Podila minutissima]
MVASTRTRSYGLRGKPTGTRIQEALADSPVKRQRVSVKKLASPKRLTPLPQKNGILAKDAHGSHPKDGHEHHIIEEDGLDRHHIWFKDFENEIGHNRSASAGNQSKSNRGDIYRLRDGHLAHHFPTAAESVDSSNTSQTSQRPTRSSKNRLSSSSSRHSDSTVAHTPLKITVDHNHRRLHVDGTDHHEIEADGRDHHHIRYDSEGHAITETETSDGGAHAGHSLSSKTRDSIKTIANRFSALFGVSHHPAHDAVSTLSSHSSSSRTTPNNSVVHTETRESTTPMHHIDSVSMLHDGYHATTHYYQESNSATTTTTTTTTTDNHELQAEHRRRHTRDEAATRLITQKSQLDRQKARDAILSLESDLTQMQRLLQEKEDALHAAEAKGAELQQVTIRTETLSREIHDLEITIHDLRTNLQSKEKALKESQHQLAQDRNKGQEQQKHLESEISKLHANLRDKESAQQHAKELEKDLDDANKQRARLIVQIREISETLEHHEAELKRAHSSVKNLEMSNDAHAKDVLRLSSDLISLKKELADREHKLSDCRRKIKTLEGAQEKVHSLGLQLKNLRDQLSERNDIVHGLEKNNKALTKDSRRAEMLGEEVGNLRESIKERELQLNKALKEAKDLQEYKELAISLEDELKDLRDQVNVQEKHLTYLEVALEAHENCAVDAQQLQDQIDSYELLLREKETKIHDLQKANEGLQKKDARITALEGEMEGLRHEIHTKEHDAAKIKEKVDNDIAKISSTASTLRVEVEGLRQELQDKNRELRKTNKDIENLGNVHDTNMNLTVEITRLEKHIALKGQQLKDLERTIDTLRGHEDRANRLDHQVKHLEKESRLARKTAEQAAKDMASSSSTASKLVVQVESLRQQLIEKENLLRDAEKVAKDLEIKTHQIKELLVKISGLEDSSDLHLKKARHAEDKVKALQKDISGLEARLSSLQHQLEIKEASLNGALNKANEDSEATHERMEEMRELVSQLKKQIKDAEEEVRHQRQLQKDKIKDLTTELQGWKNHEAKWIDKTNELTQELERGVGLVHQKEKRLHDAEHKLNEKNAEIGRLNDALNHGRGELAADRKRRVSEIEEKVVEKTTHLHIDNHNLKRKIADLEGHIVHLEKRIRLDHDREVKEQELGQKIRELNVWKQNAIQQATEWETTASNFENERKKQDSALSGFEREVAVLQTQLENADAWRFKAIAQAEQLTVMITQLETELSMIKAVLAQHDANDARMNGAVHTMTMTIETLETAKYKLQGELLARNTEISRLQNLLKEESETFKVQQAVIRKDMAVKEKKIESLHSRITEYTRTNAALESKITKGKDLLAQLEGSNDRLKGSLGAQAERYKALDNKYQAILIVQADQDKQLYKLEKNLGRVTAEDADKLAQARSRIRHLEKELERDNEKVDEMQVQIHTVTRQYHNTLAKLENATAQMAGMVPAAEASHDACAARIQYGERTITELDGRVDDLEKTILHMTKKMDTQNGQWSAAESGYKDRIHKLTTGQNALETRLHAAEHGYDHERLGREQDRLRAEREGQKKDEQIQEMRRANKKLQHEFTSMETRMRKEISATKDLMDLLSKLRNNIRRDSEAELHNLDELEKEIKSRSSVVVETIQTVRSRMDSGAFLESNETGGLRSSSSSLTGQRHVFAH